MRPVYIALLLTGSTVLSVSSDVSWASSEGYEPMRPAGTEVTIVERSDSSVRLGLGFGKRVDPGLMVEIKKFGRSFDVINNCRSSVLVPTNSEPELNKFVQTHPACVSLNFGVRTITSETCGWIFIPGEGGSYSNNCPDRDGRGEGSDNAGDAGSE